MVNNRKFPGNNPNWQRVAELVPSGRADVSITYPTQFDMVRLFHLIAGLPIRDFGEAATAADINRRINLIIEECQHELLQELEALKVSYSVENLAKVLDSCVDLCYVAMGLCVELGLPFDTAFSMVQEANLQKVKDNVIRREDGKILKPEGWKPPNIIGLLTQLQSMQAARKVAANDGGGAEVAEITERPH